MTDVNNLLKDTFFVRNILTPYLLRNDREMVILPNSVTNKVSIIISISASEVINLRENYMHEYKQIELPYKFLYLAYINESSVCEKENPLSYADWIKNKITEMELCPKDQKAFDAWMIGQKNHD